MSNPMVPHPAQKWLIENWLDSFTHVLRSMMDDRPSLTWSAEGEREPGGHPLIIEQHFAGSPEPLLWIGVPEGSWRDIGSRVLHSAGVETVSDEESRGTALEILQQSIGGLARAMTTRMQRDIAVESCREGTVFPEELTVFYASVQYADAKLPSISIAFSPLLIEWLEEKPAPVAAVEIEDLPEEGKSAGYPASKTFDLLLDVALPVSISFGKTELPVKEVLKLTTGSIVELNRAIAEPVDVIVNECVIARGEVVVVDGNYGVRINQIVSRQERLRTGTTSAARRVTRE